MSKNEAFEAAKAVYNKYTMEVRAMGASQEISLARFYDERFGKLEKRMAEIEARVLKVEKDLQWTSIRG